MPCSSLLVHSMDFASPLILLIPLSLALITLQRMGSEPNGKIAYTSWQGEFLVSLSIWGALIIVITEVLSLFTLINRLWLALAWGLVVLATFKSGLRAGRLSRGWQRIKTGLEIRNRFESVLLFAMVAYIGLLFVIAVVAPSNNVDAMQYHLPRALHWLQNGSLQHYPTARIQQVVRPYWAEGTILHLIGLWGSDKPAQLVQWLSMVASVVGVTGITRLISAGQRRHWMTAVFALTIPRGVLQA